MFRARRLAWIAVLAVIAVTANAAFADGSSVSPTRLVFAKSHVSNSITITNAGPASRRYSVAAYAWDQADANPIALTGTNDVVFFPGSFTVGPLQSQQIRVGTIGAKSAFERTYRVVVTELPSLQSVIAPGNAGLAFTTGFSIPIYVLPLVPHPAADVAGVTVDRTAMHVVIRNTGNIHFVATTMLIKALGTAGTLASNVSSSWFVLAQRQRAFTVAIAPGSCAAIQSVTIRFDAGSLHFEQTVSPERSCG
jgi:fimbrial chaperone protein